MTTAIKLIRSVVSVRYDEDGFHAYGTSTHWEGLSFVGRTLSEQRDFKICWSFDFREQNFLDQYKDNLRNCRTYDPSDERMILLNRFWKDRAFGWLSLHQGGEKQLFLQYSFAPDAALASLLSTAAMMGKALDITCPGFQFLDEDRPAPAVSITGFTERFEPAFPLSLPQIYVAN